MFEFGNVSGLIFDLDDTLVKTQLDFTSLKLEIGCPQEADILSFIDNLVCPIAQSKAKETVLAHELNDAQSSSWMPGAECFIRAALREGLPLAIVTRNCRQATQIKIEQNNIPISLAITREDAPAKPDPSALLLIAKKWKIAPAKIAYIGDYIYDIQAAHNANIQAWLFDNEINTGQTQVQIDELFAHKLRIIHQ